MPSYWLSKDVHLCLCGDQVIQLDLRHDRYAAYDAAGVSPLSRLVPGWPTVSTETPQLPIDENDSTLNELLQSEVLTTNRAHGKEATPLTAQTATTEILAPRSVFEDHSKPPFRIAPQHRMAFFTAVAMARFELKCLPIRHTVHSARRHRLPEQGCITSRSSAPFPTIASAAQAGADEARLQTLKVLVATFRWLRPWGYALEDRCMLDSLALLKYLAMFGYFPNWIFGVQSAPFTAHCWVQSGSIVLNDRVSHVKEFIPIMAV
jgi:Transglutaminase-like superfamily